MLHIAPCLHTNCVSRWLLMRISMQNRRKFERKFSEQLYLRIFLKGLGLLQIIDRVQNFCRTQREAREGFSLQGLHSKCSFQLHPWCLSDYILCKNSRGQVCKVQDRRELTSNFIDFKMIIDNPVLAKVHKWYKELGDLKIASMKLSNFFLAACSYYWIPSSENEYKRRLYSRSFSIVIS